MDVDVDLRLCCVEAALHGVVHSAYGVERGPLARDKVLDTAPGLVGHRVAGAGLKSKTKRNKIAVFRMK